MDKIKETIEMLECLKNAAEPIQTPDCGCGYSTLINNVKCDDSFFWVMDEAISLLEELQNIKTQQMVVIKNNDKCELDKLKEMLSNQRGLFYADSNVEIEPVWNKNTFLGEKNGSVDVMFSFDIKEGMFNMKFVDNSTHPFESVWNMQMTEDQAKQFAQRLVNFLGGA